MLTRCRRYDNAAGIAVIKEDLTVECQSFPFPGGPVQYDGIPEDSYFIQAALH